MSRVVPLFMLAALAVVPAALAETRVTIVSESKLIEHWKHDPSLPLVVPGFPAGADHARDVCVTLGYQIDSKGLTSNPTQLSSWSSDGAGKEPDSAITDPYVQLAAAAIARWRFVPNGRARTVYTATTFGFPGGATDAATVRSHCAIADLEDYIARLQSEQQDRGNLLKARMERQAREQQSARQQ